MARDRASGDSRFGAGFFLLLGLALAQFLLGLLFDGEWVPWARVAVVVVILAVAAAEYWRMYHSRQPTKNS